MGFLSGRKKADNERRILEVKGTMNAMTLRMRRLDTRIDAEQQTAKKAISRGDREQAKAHLRLVVDLENRRGRYHQQFLTLETALLNIEEAKDQAEVLRAFTVANEALTEARAMLSPAEIQVQLDRLEDSFEHISIAGDLLSESLGDTSSAETDERVERQLDAMEAEVLLEKEGMLPPLGAKSEAAAADASASEEKRVDEMLADLEKEAKEEREREAQG
jgi:charged multivesicular body protein 4